jgi:hypothetical protein
MFPGLLLALLCFSAGGKWNAREILKTQEGEKKASMLKNISTMAPTADPFASDLTAPHKYSTKPFTLNSMESGGNDGGKGKKKKCRGRGGSCSQHSGDCCFEHVCSSETSRCETVPGEALEEKLKVRKEMGNWKFPGLKDIKPTTRKVALLQLYVGPLYPFFPLVVASYRANMDMADFVLVHIGPLGEFYGLGAPDMMWNHTQVRGAQQQQTRV